MTFVTAVQTLAGGILTGGVYGQGVTVLLVEQNAHQSLRLADRAYVLESGRMVLSGTGRELLQDDQVRKAYLAL